MNCANHPERPATAFCQSCGKPLCHECTRTFEGLLLCEPDFVTRGGAAGPAPGFAPGFASGPVPPQTQGYRPVGWTPPAPAPGQYPAQYPVRTGHASPVLAGLLGFIPGVGAMYNGQFIKALLHVIVFIVLIGISEHFDLAGILIAAWVFYQVFDAAQTAAARRDGRPLPDPFGILDMSHRLGPQGTPVYPPAPYPNQAAPNPPFTTRKSDFPNAATPSSAYSTPGSTPGQAPQPGAAFGAAYAQPYTPGHGAYADPARDPARDSGRGAAPNPGQYSPHYVPVPAPPPASFQAARRSEPVGAIVLIVVGLLFLLSTLGVLDIGWISRGWPVLVLLLGIWLLIRRVSAPAPPAYPPTGYAPPPPAYGPAPDPASAGFTEPGTGIVRTNPLSITAQPAFEDRSASQTETVRTDEEEK